MGNIVDTHIHLFDIEREGGIPWPPAGDAVLFRTASPARYREVTRGMGIGGAIAVECSPRVEDNAWLLEAAGRDPIILGVVGNLEPGMDGFRENLERFAENPLFVGIRSGNLWGRDFKAMVSSDRALGDLRELARLGLTLDVANPNLALLEGVVQLAARIPELRVVVDHLPGMAVPLDGEALARVRSILKTISGFERVFVKVSAVLRRRPGGVVEDPGVYGELLDGIWDVFGPDRVLYASDWPNSDRLGPYGSVLGVVASYLGRRVEEERMKFFSGNARAAYPRSKAPGPSGEG